MSDNTSDLHEYLVRCMTSAMQNAGIDISLAQNIANQVEEDVRRNYGGDTHYVRAPSKQERNRKVINLWRSGKPRPDIAKLCDIGTTTVNRIISNHLQQQNSGFGRSDWNL